MTRLFTFIGVTTGQSAVMQIFPRWRDLLGLGSDIQLVGWDLPIHAPEQRYRDAVLQLRDTPQNLGGLVTTHKIDLYRAARDLFDEVNDYTTRLEEVSCISKSSGRLLGWALDPVSVSRTLDGMLRPRYFAETGGGVLCYGAGGAGLAIALYLIDARRDDPPVRLIMTDRSEERLEAVRALHRDLGASFPLECLPASGRGPLKRMERRSLIINATGMGKDIPGSPLGDEELFPEEAIAWDLNYRGELDFLRQAARQTESRGVRVEDGWQYFIHGWAVVMEKVFARPLSASDLRAMADVASFARPSHAAIPTGPLVRGGPAGDSGGV
jgi:shikimate dehydrogenase